MPLGKWNRFIEDGTGLPVAAAVIEVRSSTTGALAAIYSDRAGLTPITNPTSSDVNGFVGFFAAGGAYDITATKGAFSKTFEYEPIGTAQELDAGDLSGYANLRFQYDIDTSEGPDDGRIRLDDTILSDAEYIYISIEDRDGIDHTDFLAQLGDSTTLDNKGYLFLRTLAGDQVVIYKILDAVEIGYGYGYVIVPVEYMSGSISFDDGAELALQYSRTGDRTIGSILYDEAQGLTAPQQAQAQTNLGLTTFVQTLMDDLTAGAFMTTLGISAFVQTILNDADAATVRATISAVSLAGDTMSGLLILSADPAVALGAATKQYVDSVAAGLDVKPSVKCATTANITLSGEQTLDGVLTSASRVLVKNQSTASQNGIYVSAAGAWARATDMDSWLEVPGAFVFVEEGTLYADTGWVSSANAGGTLGSTSITWSQFSGAGTYSAGTGLSLTGTQFAISDVELLAIAGLTSAADRLAYFTGSGTAALATFTAFARTLLDDADAVTMRATLELTIGTHVQAYHARLADIAGITYAQGDILYHNGTNLVKLAKGIDGQFLKIGATVPLWAAVPGGGDLLAANNLSDVANAATAFANIKQAASTSATGVVQLADAAALSAKTTGRVLTADNQVPRTIMSGTASGVSTVDINFASYYNTFHSFELLLSNLVPASDGQALYCRVANDGTTFLTTSDYSYAGFSAQDDTDSFVANRSAGTDKFIIASNITSNAAHGGYNGKIWFIGADHASIFPRVNWTGYTRDDSSRTRALTAGGCYEVAGLLKGIRLYMSSGNISTLRWQLTGLPV